MSHHHANPNSYTFRLQPILPIPLHQLLVSLHESRVTHHESRVTLRLRAQVTNLQQSLERGPELDGGEQFMGWQQEGRDKELGVTFCGDSAL